MKFACSLNAASVKGKTIHLNVYVCSFGTTSRRMHTSHELNVYRANLLSIKQFLPLIERGAKPPYQSYNFIESCFRLCGFQENFMHKNAAFSYISQQKDHKASLARAEGVTIQGHARSRRNACWTRSVWFSVGFPDSWAQSDDESCFPVSLSAS